MDIHNIEVRQSAGREKLSGQVDDFELWFDFPLGANLQPRADAFVCAALIPAMQAGSDIKVPADILLCPVLVQNLYKVQDVFLCRQAGLGVTLKPVRITGGKLCAAGNNGKTVSFFSGGVDGTYTYLKEKDNIDDLLFVKGIDIQLNNDSLYAEAYQRNLEFLRSEGRDLLQVSSNIRYLGYAHKLSWNSWNGGGLASIAIAAGYKQCLIASGKSYAEFFPEGTCYVSDHLWSSAGCQIEHHGAGASRLQKTMVLAEQPKAMSILRVCWHDQNYNCGQCEKCLRTMVALELLSVKGAPFPPWGDTQLNELARLTLHHENHLANFEHLQQLAREKNNKKIYAAITKILRKFYWSMLFKQFDRLLLGSRMLTIKRKLSSKH